MKANLTLQNWKIKVWLWNKEDHPITVTMTREVFTKLIANCLSKRSNEYDVRDFNEEQWNNFLTRK